ncbi:MAG TPA: glycoside hydrolase family 43 protein [Longimicrobiales bacterium]
MTSSQKLLSLAALLLLAACGGGGPDPIDNQPDTCMFANPIAEGQDPWVVRSGDAWYLVQSKGREIWVYKTDKLNQPIKNAVRVWSAPASGWNAQNVWAPELHLINGHWYIYYAAGQAGPPYIYQRSGVLESVTTDPQGAYVDKGMLITSNTPQDPASNIWAIDLTVETINGQLYGVWSGWEQNQATDATPQHLYIARMANPWTIGTSRVKISSPTESWEKGTELDLDEGPEFLEHNGSIFIIYSTRESWLPAYKLGQLKLTSAAADPLDPASWVKSGPVFTGTSTVYGVGHASFTTSSDGTEDWIVYHSKIDAQPGWNRVIRTQKFGWNADGSPSFGTPVPSGVEIDVPSGQCK